MPFSQRTNNRILPANSRAVDVATRTLRDLIPVQQRRYQNAFEVQGYETIVYQRLWHGPACSCQNHRGTSANYLDQDGKLDAGTMDSLLTGGLEFGVTRYAGKAPTRSDMRSIPSRFDEGQTMDGDEFTAPTTSYVISSDDLADPFGIDINVDVPQANGKDVAADLDDISEVFDGDAFLNDSRCAMCFGSGYIGGFSVLNGQRMILHTNSQSLTMLKGTKEYNQVPHAFCCTDVEFRITLPKGAIAVDAFCLWNNDKRVFPGAVLLDGLPYSDSLLLALCDGREHNLSISFEETESMPFTYFTHVELQFNLSRTIARFELPKASQNEADQLQDATGDMSINASPVIPMLKRGDVLAETTYGKALIVKSATPWNTRERDNLGWDVETRVLQPSELLNLLPRRLGVHGKTTYLVRDNMGGGRRT